MVDRLKFVAKIFLDDRFHVLGECCELGFDVTSFSPRTIQELGLFVICKMQYTRKTLTKSDRINKNEFRFSGGNGGQNPKHRVLDEGNALIS